jgi:MoaA/NifB/PqqE/SkfB family radical SAM enzyme
MLPPPRFLFVQVNKRCNLRCQHCDFWTLDDDDKPNYLSWPRKQEILREFGAMNPQGAVVICGGESMLDLEDYFSITTECKSLGVRCLSVVNGTRIRSASMAERMILEGPTEISISLNSHRPDLHDRTRGVPGAFDKAVRALRLLIEARKKYPERKTRIYVMGLIFDENYRELDDFYDFILNDVKADKLKLNFLQPSFGHNGEVDPFFAEHHGVDPEILGGIIERCNEKYKLNLSPVWLRQVKMYFKSVNANTEAHRGWNSPWGTTEHICNTYERNIMVDHYGVARLCFATGFPGRQLQAPGDLRAFWESADPIRAVMRNCNHYCGISHSVRRENATLKTGTPAVAAAPQTLPRSA